jgi:hypothetical protein
MMDRRLRPNVSRAPSSSSAGPVGKPGGSTLTGKFIQRQATQPTHAPSTTTASAQGEPPQQGSRATTGHDVATTAAAGVVGAGGPLPHLDAIQRSFGGHDVSSIESFTGGAAAEAADAIGAEAYATGNKVAFASAPSLFVAAHEAAHVVQQRASVQLLGGVGADGDIYEQHADAVAERVVHGESATDLLGPIGGAGHGEAVQRQAKKAKKRKSIPASPWTSLAQALDRLVSTIRSGLQRLRPEYRRGFRDEGTCNDAIVIQSSLANATALLETQKTLPGKGTPAVAKAEAQVRDLQLELLTLKADEPSYRTVLDYHLAWATPQRTTGVGVVDEGTVCERESHDGHDCWLTDTQRIKLLNSLAVVVKSSMQNFNTAIQNARVELLTASKPGWTFLSEFLFYTGSGALIGRALKGIAKVREHAAKTPDLSGLSAEWRHLLGEAKKSTKDKAAALLAKVPDEIYKEVLTNASRGVRTNLKNAAHKKAGTGNKGKVAFLEIVQNDVKLISDDLLLEAPTKLDDAELAALVEAYRDAEVHSVTAYRAEVDDLLSRYESSRVGEIGQRDMHVRFDTEAEPTRGVKLAVRLRAGGKSRLALVRKEKQGRGPETTTFLAFITDPSFATLAVNLNEAKVGQVETIDVDNHNLWAGDVLGGGGR